MKRFILAVGLLVLMGSQPAYAEDSVQHTFHSLVKKAVAIVHVTLHGAEAVVDYTMAPIHAILNALGDSVEE